MTKIKGKYIFLDIDGVLNSQEWFKKNADRTNKGLMLDTKKVKMLSNLARRTDAKIICSSSWRGSIRNYCEGEYGKVRMDDCWVVCNMRVLEKYGIKFSGFTPYHWSDESKTFFNRGLEIMEYALQNDLEGNFVVLDDDTKDLQPFEVFGNLVNTSWFKGLEEKHIPMIEKILDSGHDLGFYKKLLLDCKEEENIDVREHIDDDI